MPDIKCRERLPFRDAEIAQKRYEDAEAELQKLGEYTLGVDAELAAVGGDLQDQVEYTIRLRERAENAEAEVERAWGERDRYMNKLMERNTQLQQAEATIERLKCCGNCTSAYDCGDYPLDDPCHFTPPRWSFDHVDRSARDEATVMR